MHHFGSEESDRRPENENTVMDQMSTATNGTERGLETNVDIKTEVNSTCYCSCEEPISVKNEEHSVRESPLPKNGVSVNINSPVQFATKRKLVEKEFNSSKMRAVSLAPFLS